MNDPVAAFRTEHYQPLSLQLVTDTSRELAKAPVAAACVTAIEGVISNLARRQAETELPPVAYLMLSVLYTGVYFGEYRLRLDFYDRAWPLATPIHSESIDAAWLFTHWQAHTDALTEAAKHQRTWVRSTHLESLRWQSVELLVYCLYAQLKYWLQGLDISPAFAALQREEQFFLLFGEYQAWNHIVLAIRPPVDLLQCDSDEGLRFRRHDQRCYRHRQFTDIDLRSSQFHNCRFEHCSFSNVDLRDTVFSNCRLANSTLTQVKLSGALFVHSRLQDLQFQDASAEAFSQEDGRIDNYRSLAFVNCTLETVAFRHCHLPHAVIIDSQQTGITVTDSDDTAFETQNQAKAQPHASQSIH